MPCDFTSFSTVFQSYQDKGRIIMKGCVQWNPVYGLEEFALSEALTRDRSSLRSALNPLSYRVSFFPLEKKDTGIAFPEI